MSAEDEQVALSADTQALLDRFLSDRAETERKREDVAIAHEEERNSPEAFVELFKEDWQLSQFWYTPAFSRRLAECLRREVDESSRIAFVCAPSAYVAFRHAYPNVATCFLLEHDHRFEAFARREYVHYDLTVPRQLPEELLGSIDFALIDPPFLNASTNIDLAVSLRLLLKASGRIALLTSPSVEELPKIYARPPLGPLRQSKLAVQHAELNNAYVCWTSWDGGQDFGAET